MKTTHGLYGKQARGKSEPAEPTVAAVEFSFPSNFPAPPAVVVLTRGNRSRGLNQKKARQ
jgi:hypothetical protein